MSSQIQIAVEALPLVAPERQGAGWRPSLRAAENLFACLALAALAALPLAESFLRKTVGVGISGSTALVQHLTLIIGMLGGMIAARENRLLALSNLGTSLNGRWKPAARLFCGSCAAAICALLAMASLQFVLAEKPAGRVLAYGIRTWWIQSILPLGFAAVALRLLWHCSETWLGRAAAAGATAAALLLAVRPPVSPAHLVGPALTVLFAASVLGVPVFVTLGGVALILFWGLGQPLASIPIDHYSLVTNPSLPTIPLFTLAGYLLAEGGAPRRLVRVFRALFSPVRGGTAIVTALACAFFTSFTGASGVTIVAVGGLLMPVLLAEGYADRAALGLVTGAGSLGLLLPPCLPLILYAIVAKVPMRSMFLGGILPGILMIVATGCWGISQGAARGHARPAFEWAEARRALWEAKWELLLPVVAFTALFGGFATPVEAAAVTALYAFLAETVIYGDLSLKKDLPRVVTECGLVVGGVLLILGVALGLTNYLVDVQVTARAVDWITGTIHSRWVFLLVLNLFLLVVGGCAT